MKKLNTLLILSFITIGVFSQDTSNFYDIKAKWDLYFDSIIDIRGIDSMQGTGYAPYMRKATYWEQLLYPHGDFSIWEQGITDHLNDFLENGENIGNTLDWKIVGPVKMPEDGIVNQSNEKAFRGLGQIHYIAFDPNDDTHKKMFVCSPAGGLWVSQNGGETWENGGTDLELDFSGVSSVAIDPQDSEHNWFITTGCAEGMPGHLWWQHAIGVWRTTNAGNDWDYIGLNDFEGSKIQQIRKLIIVPSIPGKVHLFVVANKGVFECENALLNVPVWDQIIEGNYV